MTGANGFVGRHLIRRARANGRDVTGVVRSEAAASTVSAAGGGPAVVEDLESEGLAATFQGAAAVVHLAAIGAAQPGHDCLDVNLGGTRRVIAAARAAGVRRIVYFSGLGVARYGMARRCTNPYFLSKLAAEVELLRSGLEAVVFRPSYILGPGDGLVSGLMAQMAAGTVEQVDDGSYRLQPIHVADAAAAALAATLRPESPAVFDLVGPEAVSFQELLDRLARTARRLGRAGSYAIREVSIEEAERRAVGGGFHGLLPDGLDCLLCDEVADPRPLEALLGRPLVALDETLEAAVRGLEPPALPK